MRHPLESMNPKSQKNLFIILLSLTILIMLVMNIIGAPLTTASAPAGIVSFELAFSPGNARQMLSSWDQEALLKASFIQGLDFLFPLVYSTSLGLGCLLAARSLCDKGKPLPGLGRITAWGLVLGALFDYIENIALLAVLFGSPRSPFPEIAGVCALIKFTIIFFTIAYMIYGLIMKLLVKTLTKPAT